jgi:hypothetical protein
VSADLDAITGERFQQAHIEVERDNRTRIAYPRREQPRRRAGPSAHVETTPARADSDRIELPDRERIEDLLQERQPRPLELFGPVLTERVLRHRQETLHRMLSELIRWHRSLPDYNFHVRSFERPTR